MVYRWIRDLHLYAGLFVSPFVLLFAGSVFVLNHASADHRSDPVVSTVGDLRLPDGLADARGRAAVALAGDLLPQLDLNGEIGPPSFNRRTRHFRFTVSRPDEEAAVDLDVDRRTAVVSRRATTMWEAVAYLHKMPGPHNQDIRGNWLWTRLWRWGADGTVYLLLFLSVSGAYLWYGWRTERRAGVVLLAAGAASVAWGVYVLVG